MKRLKNEESKPVLSFYLSLSIENLNYEEFKNKIYQRMKVLRKLEQNLKDFETIKTLKEDVEGHFCLKLVASQSKWSSIWFINMESQNFKNKCNNNIAETKQFFLENFWPKLKNLEIKNNLIFIGYKTVYCENENNNVLFNENCKIHFTKCSDIMARRTHKMKQGYFDLDNDIMISLMTSEFKRTLEDSIDYLYDRIVNDADERLIRLNKEIFTGGDQTPVGSSKNIFSDQSLFPLCIQGLMQKFEQQKHLKYNDRQTICLFLKDIGCSLNDCISYFRNNFNCTADQFNKEYLYSIRHNYGLEGKRANYTSFTCSKLISFSNDINSFGCPFVKNRSFIMKNADINDIEDFGKNPTKCCSKFGLKFLNKEENANENFNFYTPAEYYRLMKKNTTEK